MKKYLNKIIFTFLLFTIIPMAKGLCFQDLLNSGFKVKPAQAETVDNIIVPEMAVCVEGPQDIFKSVNYFNLYEIQPASNHNNSLLPCCLDENHPTAFVSTNSVDLEKFVPQIFFNTEKIHFVSSEPSYYEAPITAPPELYSIQKTILRL